MKARTTKSNTAPRGNQALGDPGTLRNPHARPRCGSRRPMAEVHLAVVEDHTAAGYEPRLLVLVSEPLLWDNMARWSIVYRCRYGSGHEDAELHDRDFVAAARDGAIEQLRRRMVGFDVSVIELYAVRAPLTGAEREAVHAANEWLELQRRAVGILGDGPLRARSIEAWLAKR